MDFTYVLVTVYRSLRILRGRDPDYQVNHGRPRRDEDESLESKSDRNQFVKVWLRDVWGPENLDRDPSGSQYHSALDVMQPEDIYPDMLIDWDRSHMPSKLIVQIGPF